MLLRATKFPSLSERNRSVLIANVRRAGVLAFAFERMDGPVYLWLMHGISLH